MTPITRDNEYVRREQYGETIDEFFRLLEAGTNSQLLDTLVSKQQQSVEHVLAQYKQDVGLELLTPDLTKTASAPRYISLRHKLASAVVSVLQEHPELIKDIESLCSHSGGHKGVHSVIHFLRDKLGEDISYSDEALTKFILETKERFKDALPECCVEEGAVGTQHQDHYDDQGADYFNPTKR